MSQRYEEDGAPIINPVTGKTSTANSDDELLYKTLEHMDKHNIVKCFICGYEQNINRWMKEAPERFLPSTMVYVDPPRPSIEYIREAVDAGRIMAIGEILSQFEGIPPNDPRVEPYFSLAEELDIPVLLHASGYGAMGTAVRCEFGNPLLLEDVLIKHPDLRLCIAHAGYPFLAETASIMMQYPNVYADVSAINYLVNLEGFHYYLRSLMYSSFNLHPSVKHGIVFGESIGKRLMFGTDSGWWPEAIRMAVGSIDSAEFLTEEQKRDIFYNNAKRFLRL
jgi:predicted TIM-barrel fold metal-dependent hydrolase